MIILLPGPSRAGEIPTTPIPDDSLRAGRPPIAAPADSVQGKRPPLRAPASWAHGGTAPPLATWIDAEGKGRLTLGAREGIRRGLGLGSLESGSPHLPDPLFLNVPGRDIPELRVDGIAVSPVRWPETSLSPIPTLALGEAVLRPYSPINGPLSSTGGPQIDVRLAPASSNRAQSAVRITQATFGTFTEELALRRPLGTMLFHGFYGDSKSLGNDPWWEQFGQTIGLRLGRSLASGYLELGADQASNRFRLLSTKKGIWERTAWTTRWLRPDSSGTSIETAASWTWTRGAWWTARGMTERRSRAVGLRAIVDRPAGRGRGSLATEIDFSRTFVRRPDEARRLQEDLSAGVAAGWSRQVKGGTVHLSAGGTRIAPLAASPVFAGEYVLNRPGWQRVSLHASRAVRNRTLPRMPSDGEAWVLQGIGLAEEESGEQPEGMWQGGVALGGPSRDGGASFQVGSDLLWMTRSLALADSDLVGLGTGGQSGLSSVDQRGNRGYGCVWGRWVARLPFGFRLEGGSWGVIAEGGVMRDLGLPSLRGTGEIGWCGDLFKGDLGLDLSVQASGRSRVATPYGRIPAQGTVDGSVRAVIGSVELFLVMANLTDVISPSMSYDGGFYNLPRRNMRAGIRWAFLD